MNAQPAMLALLLLSAGCFGGAAVPELSPAEACTADPLTESSALNASTRKTLPTPPDTLDRASVREFAIASEEAALWNNEYRADMTFLRVEVLEAAARSVDGGYEVVLDVELSARHSDDSISDDGWTAIYFLDGIAVKRVEGDFRSESPPDPERTVACWA